MMFKVKLLAQGAVPPVRATEFAAGCDLAALHDTMVPSFGQAVVETGIAVEIPAGHYGRLSVRSGLCFRHSLHVGAGVIDQDYRGPVKALIFNTSGQDFLITRGQRFAQLILEQISLPQVVVVDSLSTTDRGNSGFGSTGS